MSLPLSLENESNKFSVSSNKDEHESPLSSQKATRRWRHKIEPRSKSIDRIDHKKSLNEHPNRYKFDGEVLGKGSFGTVYKVYDRITKCDVAMKVIPLREDEPWHVEPILGLRLSHPGLVELYDIYFITKYLTSKVEPLEMSLSQKDQNSDGSSFISGLSKALKSSDSICSLNIIFEYATHGDLIDYIIDFYNNDNNVNGYYYKYISDDIIANMTNQIVSTVKYLHENNVAHRDIKPDNIVMNISASGEIILKIIDLGMGCLFNSTDRLGSGDYAAPEIFNRDEDFDVFLTDIWSIGIIVYTLGHGLHPFELARNNIGGESQMREIHELNDIDFGSHIPLDEKLFIYRCLTIDANKRADIYELSQHPFIFNYVSDSV